MKVDTISQRSKATRCSWSTRRNAARNRSGDGSHRYPVQLQSALRRRDKIDGCQGLSEPSRAEPTVVGDRIACCFAVRAD